MHATQSPRFFLQDSRSNTGDNLMFWAQGGGYTSNLARAEAFDEEAAFRQHSSRPSDIPWPAAYVEQHTHRVVDCQYVNAPEAQAWPEQGAFYRQSRAHSFVGNDLVFEATDGGVTTDLDRARVFSRDEMLVQSVGNASQVFWPVGYLDAKSRVAANSRQCHLAEVVQPAGRKLVVPKRPAPERYKCHGCHIFLKAADYFGNCPRCGVDNRP